MAKQKKLWIASVRVVRTYNGQCINSIVVAERAYASRAAALRNIAALLYFFFPPTEYTKHAILCVDGIERSYINDVFSGKIDTFRDDDDDDDGNDDPGADGPEDHGVEVPESFKELIKGL